MAIQLLRKAEERLHELQSQGLKVSSIEALTKQASAAIDERKRDKAILTINELGEQLGQINDYIREYSTITSACKKTMKDAESMSMDITDYVEMLNAAGEQFLAEHFTQAISEVKECKQQLIDGMFLFLSEEIKVIYIQLKELPQKAIQGRNFQQLFNDVDSALKENDFSLAWIITKQLKETSTKLIAPYLVKLQEHAKDKIIEFQNMIEEARKEGADLDDAKEVFSELVDRMKKANLISEYREIIDYTHAGKSALDRARRRKERLENQSKGVKELLDKTIADFEELKKYCAIPNSVEELVKVVLSDFSVGNFESVKENIKTCNLKLDKLRVASEPKIELTFGQDDLKADIWNRTKITITNKGLACANDLNIKFSGPIQIQRMPELNNLDFNKTKTYEIGLKPEGAGSLPIDVDIDFIRPWDGKTYHDRQALWLDVKTSDSQQPMPATQTVPVNSPVVGRTTRSENHCILCKNEIPKSAPIFKCNCGTIYHLDCITDLDSCLNCSAPIKHQVGLGVPVGRIPHERSDSQLKDVDWD